MVIYDWRTAACTSHLIQDDEGHAEARTIVASEWRTRLGLTWLEVAAIINQLDVLHALMVPRGALCVLDLCSLCAAHMTAFASLFNLRPTLPLGGTHNYCSCR